MRLKRDHGAKSAWNKALHGLVLPSNQPRTPELLLREYVRQVRGHKLFLVRDPEVASPTGPSGMWVTCEGVDLIWVHPGAAGIHERRILAHEFGHMVNGDDPDPVDLKDIILLLKSMCRHTSSSLWESATCRTDFDDPREQRAEEFSYFTEEWLSRNRAQGPTLADSMRASLDTRNEFW